jgi:hypothetical protein
MQMPKFIPEKFRSLLIIIGFWGGILGVLTTMTWTYEWWYIGKVEAEITSGEAMSYWTQLSYSSIGIAFVVGGCVGLAVCVPLLFRSVFNWTKLIRRGSMLVVFLLQLLLIWCPNLDFKPSGGPVDNLWSMIVGETTAVVFWSLPSLFIMSFNRHFS